MEESKKGRGKEKKGEEARKRTKAVFLVMCDPSMNEL